MNLKLVLLLVVFAAFAVLSLEAMWVHGYVGLFTYQFASLAGWQVLADLTLCAGLAILWMIGDARRQGRRAWPYVLLTLAAGAFGPLTYLLIAELRRSRAGRPALA